jgi:hypothetical protein
MALRAAVASGNWSNPAIWNGGVLPSAGDIVASNNFVVTIDQNINVDRLINSSAISNGTVPLMTSNTMPSGIADQSSSYSGSDLAWRAFDQNNSTYWRSTFPSGWISYEFTSFKIITAYYFVNYQSNYVGNPKDWTFEGWNGSSWVVLHTVTNYPGNLTTYTSPDIGNTTSYIRYRLNISLTFATGTAIVNTLALFESLDFSGSTVAGGGFILNDGVTVTCTNSINGFVSGSNSINGLIVFNLTTGQSATLIGNTQVTILSNTRVVYFNGTGTLNWIGNWEGVGSGLNSEAVFVNTGTNGGIVNFTGNMTLNSSVIRTIVSINKIFTFNMTGNIDFLQSSGNSIPGSPFAINTSFNFNLVGAIYGGRSAVISTTQTIYFNQTGLMMARVNNVNVSSVVLSSTNASSIHLMSGPFISDIYGALPFYVSRMHYQRTIGSYFEFRDNSTNGALPPAGPAPATRLVSPNTTIDSPIPANVRQGVNYALGTLTGTMKVPNPENVSKNVPIDNTIGTAVLSSADVWAVPTSELNEEGSIGQRLKNISTVESVGDQIVGLLSN